MAFVPGPCMESRAVCSSRDTAQITFPTYPVSPAPHISCVQELALDAVQTVAADLGNGQQEIDIKNYAKVEKIPGGAIEDCRVLKGVMFNKDVVVPGRMRRKILNPRILLLDCPLEYKKGENQTNVEITKVGSAQGTPSYPVDPMQCHFFGFSATLNLLSPALLGRGPAPRL